MSERSGTGQSDQGRRHGAEEDRRDDWLQTVFLAADPWLKPSEKLRRKVAVLADRHEARAARAASGWRPGRIAWASVAGTLVAAALLWVAPDRPLHRPEPGRSKGSPAPAVGQVLHPSQVAPARGHTPRRPVDPIGTRIAHGSPLQAEPRGGVVPRSAARAEPGTPDWIGRSTDGAGRRGSGGAAAGDASLTRVPLPISRRWASLPPDRWDAIEERVRRAVTVQDDFIRIPFPRLASTSDQQLAAAVESYQREAAVVDARLARPVTLQQKGMALSDLCDRLRSDTGIQLMAGRSVADEKVTLFCQKQPLRDVMRQLSRPFGYTWLRSGKSGDYKYELVQDLRSQLLEEELRNRDHNEALLSLGRDIERYRPYLDLTPDEALARTKTAPPVEKKILEQLTGCGWGPIQMYCRLSRTELEALRSGQTLTFSGEPRPGERALPPDVARGVLQSFRYLRVPKVFDGVPEFYREEMGGPDKLPLATAPEVRTRVTLMLRQSELGQFTLDGGSEVFFPKGDSQGNYQGPYAVGRSPVVLKSDNQRANARLATDPALYPRVTVQPQPSCPSLPATRTSDRALPEPKVTTADVLEALHRATGMPIVADYYTRLYKPEAVSVRNQPLFGVLNQLADAIRLRWNKEGSWLQFRSASYYNDRLKEVPNRLLTRWAAARRQRGMLTLDDLVEITQLPDVQLNAIEMAQGARECFGLAEWDLARNPNLLPHLRYLASFTPAQRQEAMTAAGLSFTRMSLAQQQRFISYAFVDHPLFPPLRSLDELAGATLRVDYSQPGGFQWGNPDLDSSWTRWVVVLEYGRQGRWAPRPAVRGRSREAVLQAVLRIDPKIRERVVHTLTSPRPKPEPQSIVPLDEQIFLARLSLTFIYFPGGSNARPFHILTSRSDGWGLLW